MILKFVHAALVIGASIPFFGVSLAHATPTCAPVLALPGVVRTSPYDPFSSGALIDDVALSFTATDCEGPISVDANIGWGGGTPRLSFDGQELSFSLSLSGTNFASSLNTTGGTGAPDGGVGVAFPTNTSAYVPQNMRLVIPEGQIVSPGLYTIFVPGDASSSTGLLTQLQGATPGSTVVRATPIAIETEVLAVMKMGVTGCDLSSNASQQGGGPTSNGELASACTLNMGDPSLGMLNGDNRRARINAQANVNFKVSMTSQNGGIMRLNGGSSDAQATQEVHYSASLQGHGFTCIGTECGSTDVISPSGSPLGTDLYFQVRVDEPDIAQKRAGVYSDTITLIIQPAS